MEVSQFVTWDSSDPSYTITRTNCSLDCQSPFVKALNKSKSLSTNRKAPIETLTEYYSNHGTKKIKKYYKLKVKITFDTIEEIIAAMKVFVFSHGQTCVDSIKINNEWANIGIKSDVNKYECFLKEYKYEPTLTEPATLALSHSMTPTFPTESLGSEITTNVTWNDLSNDKTDEFSSPVKG